MNPSISNTIQRTVSSKVSLYCKPSTTSLTTPLIASRTSTLSPFLFCRYASTTRRTTKLLRRDPHPSFTNNDNATPETATHLIFNPPAAPPTPHNTPRLFLPNNDPRTNLIPPPLPSAQTSTSIHAVYASTNTTVTNSSSPTSTNTNNPLHLPPALNPVEEKKYHLTADQIAEIKRLRAEDPVKNSRRALAKEYGCSQFFVGMIAPASDDKKEVEWNRIQANKAKWSPARKYAREERKRRRETWGLDEYV